MEIGKKKNMTASLASQKSDLSTDFPIPNVSETTLHVLTTISGCGANQRLTTISFAGSTTCTRRSKRTSKSLSKEELMHFLPSRKSAMRNT
jgi:hypothetical protein